MSFSDKKHRFMASIVLLITVLGTGAALATWKRGAIEEGRAAATGQTEPVEFVTVAAAEPHVYRPTATAIGTVLARRSITLRNELAGTVEQVMLTPGRIVAAGSVLVRLDTSVEEAELAALEAQAALAQTLLERNEQASRTRAVAELEVDRARAERDVAVAQIARTRALIERKTIRAPFRARIGMADVHPGQYLDEGTELTTLQGIDEVAHVDFAVAQDVAAGLRQGDPVEVIAGADTGDGSQYGTAIDGRIVAVDARVDPVTRNATVRARIAGAAAVPGASVRVRVPAGPAREGVAIPASALRTGPSGDHVYVIAEDEHGQPRAHLRMVERGAPLGDRVTIEAGLVAGEQVAASGSFKLREAVLVVPTPAAAAE